MVTDGVMDALPAGAQEEQISGYYPGHEYCKSGKFARGILSEVLKCSGGNADG